MTNYLFFVLEKSSDAFKLWTVIFFVVLVDIYIERFTGSNIFGFGKIEIDGVPQNLLNPRENWKNESDYDRSATELKSMFVNNFQQFSSINEKVDSVYNRLKND